MTTVATPPHPTDAAAPARHRPSARRLAHYTLRSVIAVLTDWAFLAFIVAMPTTMYLFFAGIYGDQVSTAGPIVAALMMVTMATYGGLGAALNAGAQIQSERSSGWFRQLMLTALTPMEFLLAKVITAVVVVVPGIGIVFVAGALRDVRMDAATWASSFVLLLGSLLPMVLLGLVLGLWLKQQVASAATTLTMLALSMLGGLWFPLDMLPAPMQTIGKLLPSYWAGQIGTWPLLPDAAFPLAGLQVIGVWTVGLVALGALGYRRAVRTSRR